MHLRNIFLLTLFVSLTLSQEQLGSDIDGEAANDRSGYSVSLNADGDKVAIGAYLNGGNGSSSGHVRVYEYSGGSWSQLGSDIDGEAADDFSGISVSINADGDRVAIGASANDGNGSASGHVRVYFIRDSGGSWSQLGSDIDGKAVAMIFSNIHLYEFRWQLDIFHLTQYFDGQMMKSMG